MIYGYARISTKKQSIERQIRNIYREYPDAALFTEEFTGTKIDRPQFNKMLKLLKPGDTVVFDSVSRMSRNTEEGLKLYMQLFNQDINLVFIKEHHIDTSTYKDALKNNIQLTDTSVDFILEGINKYLIALAEEQIKLAFAQSEKEVADLRQRTREGLIGKDMGIKKGTKLTTKKSIRAKEIIKEHYGKLKADEIIKLAEVSRNSYFKYVKELKADNLI